MIRAYKPLGRKQGILPRGTAIKRHRKANGGIKTRSRRVPSLSKLIKIADALFSLKVRRIKAAGTFIMDSTLDDNKNVCFTCRGIFPIKKLQCGHYLSRWYKTARWDFDNARPQCMMCNLWKRGDPIVFRQNLIKEIGEERVLAVEAKRKISTKLTREYLENLIISLK